MTQYILRRLLLLIPTLIGVSLLVTAFVRLLPGDAVDMLTAESTSSGGPQAIKSVVDQRLVAQGIDPLRATFSQRNSVQTGLVDSELKSEGIEPSKATAAQRQDATNTLGSRLYKDGIRKKIGLDKNYIGQWWSWIAHAARGDLGTSLFGERPVGQELRRRIPASFELGLMAMVVSMLVALPVGVLSAVKQDSWLDYVARSLAVAAIASPSFVVAILILIVSSRLWGYSFPLFYKNVWEAPRTNLELTLVPAIILGLGLSGSLMRLTRAQMLDVLRQDYMRTARAKGLAPWAVILRHGVRNGFVPVVTIIGLQVPVLIGGSLVLEQIFGIPGVAQYLYTAIGLRDFPVIIGVNMAVALTVMLTNLVVDLSYGFLDPRVRIS
jgi:peptide/nickel transport system permease protein